MQLTTTSRDAIMTALIAAAGPFDSNAVFLGVATAIAGAGLDTVIGNITAPPGGMATRQGLSGWGSPYTMVDGRRVVDAAPKEFRPVSSAEACVIVGWYVASAGSGGVLKAFVYTDAPIALPDETRAMTLVLRLTVDPLGRWDTSVIIDG